MYKYIVQSKVKQFYHTKNKRVARETLGALDRLIEGLMEKSCFSAGGFKTVIPENLICSNIRITNKEAK